MVYGITLKSYWHEIISSEEGLRRLADRPMTADDRFKAEEGKTAVVVAPTEDRKGFALHRFENRKGRLYVDGIRRDGFTYSAKPMQLSATFSLPVDPSTDEPEVEEISEFCCLACEFVHSTLGIHDLDFICCIFPCIDVLGDASGGSLAGELVLYPAVATLLMEAYKAAAEANRAAELAVGLAVQTETTRTVRKKSRNPDNL